MKIYHIISVISIFLTSQMVFSQTHEDLYNQANLEDDAKRVTEKIINTLATKNSRIPTKKWQDVKSRLDYSNYKSRIINVLKKHYTIDEIKEIFLQNDMFEPVNPQQYFVFKTKASANDDMYQASKISGRELMQQVVSILKE